MKKEPIYIDGFLKVFFTFLLFITLIGIIQNPSLSLNSARDGVLIWFNIILPSLLPFFIISEILIGIGIVDFIGKLLEPIMKPLFGLPGKSAFPLTISLLSGYPVGVKLTSRLREEELITKQEANRLICIASTSGPLFMLGAVSVGMLGDPKLSPLIIIPHYLSVLILGLLFRSPSPYGNHTSKNLFAELQDSYARWIKTKKPIGSLITKAVRESMDSILLIGGLVIFYSVLIEILFNMHFMSDILFFLGNFFSLDPQLIKGFAIGIFEMTIGCKNIAILNIDLIYKIVMINFIIGWSGLSVHSQALGFINKTDINSGRYMISKFFHGILSGLLGYILYILKYQNYVQPTSYYPIPFEYGFNLSSWIHILISSTKLVFSISLYILLISILASVIYPHIRKTN